LYPHHLNLWHQVDERIRDFIAAYLEVANEDAFRIQKDFYKRYGTTMRGLMAEHGLEPDEFLDYVHQIDHSPLLPNPPLAPPHALGMITVLVVPERTREVFREGWELEGREAAHVDHVTDDLVGFLQGIGAMR